MIVLYRGMHPARLSRRSVCNFFDFGFNFFFFSIFGNSFAAKGHEELEGMEPVLH